MCKVKIEEMEKYYCINLTLCRIVNVYIFQVFKARSRDDGRWYAVKVAIEPFRSPKDRAAKLKEVQKHELMPPHPNLVAFKCAWEEIGYLYIQIELCSCRCLFNANIMTNVSAA